MVILDCVNNKIKHFDHFWSAAKQKGFEVYVAEITADINDCAKKNTHNRSIEDIKKVSDHFLSSLCTIYNVSLLLSLTTMCILKCPY